MTNVLEWLEATAARRPEALAVSDVNGGLAWGELLASARAAGSGLIALGMRPRQAVALYLEKSCPALACMLGAAYAGGFYSVLDVRQPDAYVLSLCEVLQPAVVLTDADNEAAARAAFDGTPWRLVRVEQVLAADADDEALARVRAAAIDADPLYVTFTSGSSGTPKGVVAAHRSVLDFVPAFVAAFGINESDVMANQSPFDFDASVKDIYSCLLTGARMLIVPRDYFTAPTTLMDYVADGGATTLVWAVSAMCFVSIMNAFDYRVPHSVRRVIFSGEVMPTKQLAVWRRALPEATFVNSYGPTEVTCNCTYFVVDRDYGAGEVIPMGRPYGNERVYLLGADGREVTTPGERGEVIVCGTTLGLGYLGDPERTAEAYVQNPLETRWPERAYKTGDLAHYDERGDLVYDGRADNQVKHMGRRVELGDVAHAAEAVDGVEQAVCLHDPRRKRLHLFYVGGVADEDLMAALKGLLPQYMLPNRTWHLDAFPLNKNGKADRAALKDMARIR